jgi:type I restriction enzyme S subunit
MTNYKNVPVLRFKGFEDEWEVKQLGEIGDFKNGLNKDKDDFGFGKPFVNLNDVFGKNAISSNNNFGLVNANSKDISVYDLKKDDVLFIRSSVKRTGVGETVVILKTLEDTVYSGFLIRFRENKSKLGLRFKKYCFGTMGFRNKLLSYSTTSANTNINQHSLSSIYLTYPTKPEQQKIANFLTATDTKIQQLRQKKGLLNDYKKGVMQQIFKQDIRFKNDDGGDFEDWEVKKLKDVLTYEQPTKYIVSSTEYKNNYKTPVLTAGKTFILGYTDEVNNIFKHHPVIIFDDFTTAYKYVDFDFKVKSSAMKILKPIEKGINLKYIYEAFQAIKFPLGEHKRYWISEYSYMKIPFPCEAEQQKIANFLSSIDERIGKVSEEIGEMERYKKGLLQGMFV